VQLREYSTVKIVYRSIDNYVAFEENLNTRPFVVDVCYPKTLVAYRCAR